MLRIEKQQSLLQECPLEGMTLNGDKGRVTRAIAQMLENASKFSPSDTKIAVRVVHVEAGVFRVDVLDQGPGVAPEFQARVFEPFFQIDGSVTRAQGGTGIGLAVARGVARGHGGEMELTSPCEEKLGAIAFGGSKFSMT